MWGGGGNSNHISVYIEGQCISAREGEGEGGGGNSNHISVYIEGQCISAREGEGGRWGKQQSY